MDAAGGPAWVARIAGAGRGRGHRRTALAVVVGWLELIPWIGLPRSQHAEDREHRQEEHGEVCDKE